MIDATTSRVQMRVWRVEAASARSEPVERSRFPRALHDERPARALEEAIPWDRSSSGGTAVGRVSPMADVVTMDKIVSLARRRGFVFPSSAI
jgi:hypothetical protein